MKEEALRLGFDLVGACPAAEPPGLGRLWAWVEAGEAAGMGFFAGRAEAYAHPEALLPGVKSLLMLGRNYRTVEPAPAGPGCGRVARYGWGRDYHEVIRAKLDALIELLQRLVPGAAVRGVVDTAPLLEKSFAQQAGLGHRGRNTLLINRQFGSRVSLAALLTDQTLEYDPPETKDPCASCRACVKACPTGALSADGRLDARRCLSYWLIESRRLMPDELRPKSGDRVYGCDTCQEVCPWNRHAPSTSDPAAMPVEGMNPVDLIDMLGWDEATFRARTAGMGLRRAKRAGLLRNAALALGNAPLAEAVPALIAALSDPEPMLRAAAAWSLGRHAAPPACAGQEAQEAREALRRRAPIETDESVQREIQAALAFGMS